MPIPFPIRRESSNKSAARVNLESGQAGRLVSVAWVTLLVSAVAGPWLAPGYVFGTDFAGPRHYLLPAGPSSYWAFQLALRIASLALPADVVGKLLIVTVLLATGLGAYWTVPTGGFLPRAVASLVFVFNPFVYDRLAYGQIGVLTGYATLPWVALTTRQLLIAPSVPRALLTGGVLALAGIFDVHLALIAGVLVILLTISYLTIKRSNVRERVRTFQHVVLAGTVAVLASAYWLVPVLTGNGPEARTLSRIGAGDLSTFRTAPDSDFGLIPNVLGLYGFWAERTGRFISMKEFVPIWPTALAILLVVVAIGAIYTWLRQTWLPDARPWIAGLLIAAAVAIILDIGVSDSHVAVLITWLDGTFPPYRGMRDANKWAALLALVYSQLAALGAINLLRWFAEVPKSRAFRASATSVLMGFLLALPLYYGNGLLYGMHGQIQPSSYPEGWYTADRTLMADPDPGRTVFLPWHGYLSLSFVSNANRVVASPAPTFFSVPVIASEDLEVSGIASPLDDPDQALLSQLVSAGARGDWARALSGRNIKYVLLAREVGWQGYSYLDAQPGLVLIADYGSILLYRNQWWKDG